ncbi:MAG: PAS domain S-box protein, partial [Pseudomonadota bacterium]
MLNTIKGQIALSFCFVFLLLISQKISADTPFIDTFYDHNAVKLLIDPQTGKIFAANESAQNFYGYPALTSMFIQQINQLSPEQVASERLLAEQEGRSFFVFRHKLFDGSVKTVEVHSSPIVYQGKTLLFSIIKDISKQRDMQDELWHYQQHLESLVEEKTKKVKGSLNIIIILMGTALFISLITIVLMKRLIALKKSSNNQLSESKRLYDLAVEGTGVGIWSWNIKTDETYWSEQFFRLLGFKDNEIKPSLEEFQNRLHPDDMERATARLNAHLSHYEKYDLEFRLLCANNQYRWFRVMGRAQRDEDKNPIEMAGSIQDIHDKKLRSIELVDTTNRLKEEVSLRTQAEKLSETQRDRLQVILEQASDGIHILNMDGDVVYCSRSFYSKLGYTSGEALKLNVRDWEGVIPEEELRSAIANLVKEPTIFETVHVKKNGDTYPAEVTTEVVSINNQTFLYASARDITKR